MKKLILALVAMGFIALLPASATATSYWGHLSSRTGGIVGTGSWSRNVCVAWSISSLPGGNWSYNYRFAVRHKDISHFILETSPTFGWGNIWNISSNVSLSDVEIGTFGDQGNSNPNIPDSIYGIKFDLGGDTTSFQFAFESNRDPVWGDFYAKDGKEGKGKKKIDVTAWNAGFTSLDTDPNRPASSGAYMNHLLVPDGGAGPLVPELLTGLAVLLAAGGTGFYVLRRKKHITSPVVALQA